MENIQTILALTSTILGIILVFLKIFETWIKVSSPVKNFLSNWKAWLVIAALIIIGIILFICREREVRVAIRTTHGRYVSAMGADWDWVIRAETKTIDNFEEFTMLCLCDGKVAFQTFHTKDGKHRYVTAMGEDWDWILRGETTERLDFEIFTLVDVNTEKKRHCLEVINSLKKGGETLVAFQTFHTKDGKHRLVTAMDGNWSEPWILRAETTVLGASEKFTLVLLPSP